jgi:hypothetical protein
MDATAIAQTALRAWEAKDVASLAACLADDAVFRGFLPQKIDKEQFIADVRALCTAFPDWSFNAHFLNQQILGKRTTSVLFVTQISGTHNGDLILPGLPIIPVTGTRITLPTRHLECIIEDDFISEIAADFSPNGLAELLASLGMDLP